ncbi:siderophore-interacting protein [Pelagibacterium xiamenense]|uniref:siderophore-interacting protein n=1 Tax=Pelagibacterium xiamenense TaxID=2901140 RepID=UPI001E448454|nr:SIP domain-containing protein [Pelagibacterium xiamenense]MCD7058633.1 siderophore-interacting protein [Pelagibacterium xiamenense]
MPRGSQTDGRRGNKIKGGRPLKKRPFDYGDLRLMVLALVAHKPRHGYEIIRQIEQKFDGAYIPSPGAIYPAIGWLEDMKFVTVAEHEVGRKCAQITEAGSAFLAANADAVSAIWARKPGSGRAGAPQEVVAAMDALKAAIRDRLGAAPANTDIVDVANKISRLASELTRDAQAQQTSIFTRYRFEPKRRKLRIARKYYLTPHMIRLVLTGDDLKDFESRGFDDHVKLFLPSQDQPHQEDRKPIMRDYTPRAFDPDARTLTLDFAVHQAGPATQWALEARPGDSVSIGGPRGSSVIADVFDWWLLIGDETALPAIGRQVEALGQGSHVITLAAVDGPDDEQVFDTAANATCHWVHRPEAEAANPSSLLEAANSMSLPHGRGFVWIAAEAAVARALRDHFLEKGHPREALKAAGYWTRGTADASDKSLA